MSVAQGRARQWDALCSAKAVDTWANVGKGASLGEAGTDDSGAGRGEGVGPGRASGRAALSFCED